MLHITLKSEYSFGSCYGFLDKLHDNYSEDGIIGIADYNTFSFFKLKQMCNKSGKKPIFGYRVSVVEDATLKVKPKGQFGSEYIIIAKNAIGLREIYNLTQINSANFYYRANISVKDILNLTDNVITISTNPICKVDYIGIGFSTPTKMKGYNYPKVFVDENYFCENKDRGVYQLYAEKNADTKTHPQHILSKEEAITYFGKTSLKNLQVIADQVEVFDLPVAENIKYTGKDYIVDQCKKGAERLGLDLNAEPYKSRFEKEMKLIISKEYVDYLMVVADILKKAKKICFVGGGRGCFLPNQKVKTKNGYLNIEDISVGDKIFDAHGKLETCTNLFEYECNEEILEIEFQDGTIIECTKDHKILTNKGWVEAGKLNYLSEIVKNEN